MFGGSFSVFRRLCPFFFSGQLRPFYAFFCAALSFNGCSGISSSFAAFGVLDSLTALQGLFYISVRVVLVWIHSATASAVPFFLLLQVGLIAIFATMSFAIFSLMARHLFFSALLRFVLGGYAARLSNKQHGLTCFPYW